MPPTAQLSEIAWSGCLRTKDLDQNSGASGGVCLSHNVFDMFFDCLFCNFERVRDLLVRPSLRQVFNH